MFFGVFDLCVFQKKGKNDKERERECGRGKKRMRSEKCEMEIENDLLYRRLRKGGREIERERVRKGESKSRNKESAVGR